ncbi:restriction endonuclease [Brazilian marseillevirus]|uniref:restriction endonuclease n=1 Tax=Brazilian marseillevirus TaxID=1813599 RepID=UPI000785F940|nr:restriction endonuclease [Brazilian marseillevirus]AMQ10909.1 restriction endonuclease [Brazilian marseillevirus]
MICPNFGVPRKTSWDRGKFSETRTNVFGSGAKTGTNFQTVYVMWFLGVNGVQNACVRQKPNSSLFSKRISKTLSINSKFCGARTQKQTSSSLSTFASPKQSLNWMVDNITSKSNWKSPELIQKSDRYKEEQAIKNGYSVLRILQEDVWNDKIEWKKLLLEHIRDYDEPIIKNLWELEEHQ